MPSLLCKHFLESALPDYVQQPKIVQMSFIVLKQLISIWCSKTFQVRKNFSLPIWLSNSLCPNIKCSLYSICMTFWSYFGTIMTTFASKSQYFIDKSNLFFTEVRFDTSEGNQLSYFQNYYFFKILWWCYEPYNERKYR